MFRLSFNNSCTAALVSLIATRHLCEQQWTTSRRQQQRQQQQRSTPVSINNSQSQWRPLSSLSALFMRYAFLSNGQPVEPFSIDWFKPFVSIRAYVTNTDHSLFTENYDGPPYIWGSGCIMRSSGIVITTCNTVENLTDVSVRTSDGQEHRGRVTMRTPEFNLAVIQLSETRDDWPVIYKRNIVDTELRVGEPVMTVGNIIAGVYNYVSEGIINNPKRDKWEIPNCPNAIDDQLHTLIQHTASVRAGDGGTSVVDMDGRVIGVNIVQFQPTVNVCLNIESIEIYINYYLTQRALNFGLLVYWYDPQNRQFFEQNGVPPELLPDYCGILVAEVFGQRDPSVRNLAKYNIITHVNRFRVQSMDDLYRALEQQMSISVTVGQDLIVPTDWFIVSKIDDNDTTVV
ncbi:serine protease HTR4-like [Oppia nitens]|uniref:serine protease HTR4-like n=1 Tax=Oppia nitens TaxID=1686743 RepID=UPI0023DA6E61|nr:serine protease HTR4-like [Oppia nitens]